MRHFSRFCGIALFALLAGCSRDDLLQKSTNDAEQAQAIEYLEAARRNDFAKLEAVFDPEFKTPELRGQLERVSRVMPAGEPTERTLVGVHWNTRDSFRLVELVYQYRFGESWFLAACTLKQTGGKVLLYGINIQPRVGPADAFANLGAVKKTPIHYTFMAAITIVAVLSLTALILCIMERGLRRKWAWILFILFGLTTFSLNWHTGEWSFRAFFFLLFSAGASTDAYGQWVVSFSLPVGAALYMLRRRRNQFQPTLSNESGPEPT